MHLLILLYVVDMTITRDNELKISYLSGNLSVHFEMKNLRQNVCFFGPGSEKSDQGYFVSQKDYVKILLDDFSWGSQKKRLYQWIQISSW